MCSGLTLCKCECTRLILWCLNAWCNLGSLAVAMHHVSAHPALYTVLRFCIAWWLEIHASTSHSRTCDSLAYVKALESCLWPRFLSCWWWWPPLAWNTGRSCAALILGACIVRSACPGSPSSRATNLRRSSVTKLVLKLMRRVNILRRAVCIRPLTGFMFSCHLWLTSLGNSLRPLPNLWCLVMEGGLGIAFLPLWEGDRDTNQMWRQFLEKHK